MSKTEFVTRMKAAIVIAKQKKATLNTEAVIAQAALESGWGNSLLARRYNNLFGVKAGSSWKGQTVSLRTFEFYGGKYHPAMAVWRVYTSWNECLVDYSKLIRARSWFKDALPHADPPDGDGDALMWISRLVDRSTPGELKWATSPDYVEKVIHRVGAEIERLVA